MERNPAHVSSKEYDLVIIGGGIYGACAAWDAALRGLSVALVDRGDFGHATSSKPLKLVHGGFRYLQHADIARIRASSGERRTLLRIAPHLVQPIPFVIPTYGHGMRGKEILALALAIYNLVVFDRNSGIDDPIKRVPYGDLLSKAECQELFPAIERRGLTGGVVFYDGQMYSPCRLLITYLRSAQEAGADLLNYAKVTGFLKRADQITGVEVRDLLTGDELEIRSRMVVNAAGPWVGEILQHLGRSDHLPTFAFSKDWYLVVNRSLTTTYALAVPSRHKDPNALVSRGQRHLFLIPWRGYTLVGSGHTAYEGKADHCAVSERDIQDLLDEINGSYPSGAIARNEVSFVNSGLVPREDDQNGNSDVKLGRRHVIVDHEVHDGVRGLLTVLGVRFTTSRSVVKTLIDRIVRRLGRRLPKCTTDITPLWGGRIENFADFLIHEARSCPYGLNEEVMTHMLHLYGSEYRSVLKLIEENPQLGKTLGSSNVIGAEVTYAIREELACKLGDVVFRRTELGTGGHPGEPALQSCAALMAHELKWDANRVTQELGEVRSVFP
jgi:glycerol-3-phosphate dehydrogenase